ncbi:reverse transcriptase domain, reverse transcriptase zinc-binding domain protein [Tanacetum coccineum]|uniref:Reverse transcriptase domain, reverse transcriptase zinc-binding domain protein n=1 Tax=Tanacetum coccineum TaxID=301880 RepID=A0ABQ5GXI9_9ASTR
MEKGEGEEDINLILNTFNSKMSHIMNNNVASMGSQSYVNVIATCLAAKRNTLDNSLVGFLWGKKVWNRKSHKGSSLGQDSQGSNGRILRDGTSFDCFAPALIEVSVEKELKQVVTMAILIVDGEDTCPKRVVEPIKDHLEDQTDGFTTDDDDVLNVQENGESSGGNDPRDRRQLWADLGFHKNVVYGCPWVLLGNFNVPLNMEDMFTGSSSMNSAMCEFKDCIENIEVFDINSSGLHFTWNQKPKGSGGILKKLDRIMGNIGVCSDLFPVINGVQCNREILTSQKSASVESCNRSALDEEHLIAQQNPWTSINNIFVKAQITHMEFNDAIVDEERFLKQKSKIEWLEVGDSNLAYFHKSIKSCNQRSRIDVITTADNVEVSGNLVSDVFVSHYQAFLGTDLVCDELDTVGLFDKKVSEISNVNMMKPISNDEIKKAMFSIGDDKAPGPDGYTSAFFKKSGMWLDRSSCHNYHLDISPPDGSCKDDIQKAYDRLIGVHRSSPALFLTPRDIARETFSLQTHVADLMLNGVWNWPNAWLSKAPELGFINPLALNNCQDSIRWCDSDGNIREFSVKLAWEALRPRGEEVLWYNTVWFLHGIPRHAFHLWLVIRRSLKTQDKLGPWDVEPNTDLTMLRCLLCRAHTESHEHIFFECAFSSKVWILVRSYARMSSVRPVLTKIMSWFQPLDNKRTFAVVVGKLIFATTSYFIWLERNNRFCKNTRRTLEEIRDLIIVTIRLKLVTFRFKNTTTVQRMMSLWKMPSRFSLVEVQALD